jgi:hypothetical protein
MFGWLSHVLAQTQFPQNQQNSHKNGPIHKATFSTQNLNSVDPSSSGEVLVASVASNQGCFIRENPPFWVIEILHFQTHQYYLGKL